MVTVIEVQAVDIPVDGVEDLHLDPRVFDGLQRPVRQTGQGAEIVDNQVDLHPGGGTFLQYGEDLVPDSPLRQNIVLHEDISLRLPQMLHQIPEEGLPLTEIGGVRIAVQPELPLLEIGGQAAPRRAAAGQSGLIQVAEHFCALPLGDRRHRLQTQLLSLMRAAPQAEQEHTCHWQNQQQTHPAQLIRRTAAALVNPNGHHRADQLEKSVHKAGLFFQETGQQKGHRDLRQHRQGAEHQTGRCGDSPLRAFLIPMGHSAHTVTSRIQIVFYDNYSNTTGNLQLYLKKAHGHSSHALFIQR